MAGAGTAPAGTSPYGYGTPATSGGLEGVPLADAARTTQGSRWINPLTRRWEFGADGRAKGMANVRHLVLMRILTLRDSAAWKGGLEAPGGVIGTNFAAKRADAIRTALADLVTQRLIAIESITVDAKARPVFTRVQWRDLTTNKLDGTEVP